MADSVLIIGSGGREHALAWKLSQSSRVKHVYVVPGNAGTYSDPSGKFSNCDINVKNFDEITKWCENKKIDLVAVGPEDPLANGLSDHLKKAGIKCFGPCQKAAQIEASKEFAKSFMHKYNIPTARWSSFKDAQNAKDHILNAPYDALVVKASGLAAGKGVIVSNTREDAVKAVDILKQDKGLASASETIVIEELLKGEEVSVLCFSDGIHISVMPPAQDHKRLLDDDKGPNTGGMGAYCRCPQISEEDLKFIQENIMQKAIDGMKAEGLPYIGVLYAGLMMTKDGPKVLEFNCRFGDPETQVILPLLQSDLYTIMLSCVNGTLNTLQINWALDKYAVGVVLVSGGYPGSYEKGKVITGLDELKYPDYIIFHAGTSLHSGTIVTSGGRVLAVVAVEDDLQNASDKAQKGAKAVQFDGVFYRKDIAQKALQRFYHEGMTYKSAGVDIESAEDLVNKIKNLTRQTLRPEVCGGIGGFGGIFDLRGSAYKDPYLVSKCGGIGEKLKVAQECKKYENAGFDLVANSVNEILCHGAEPLFFLDTYTSGKLEVDVAAKVISGIAKGCKEANCALIGGETAEMPGMYAYGDFDLTAFARGAVEKSEILPRKDISTGDVVIGLLSSSINSSAFNIIRKLVKKLGLTYNSPAPFDPNQTLEEILLAPSKMYVKSVLPLMRHKYVKAAAFINDGGLVENIMKILPPSYKIVLDATKLDMPPVFDWIASSGNFSQQEMFEIFNCNIGMILVVAKDVMNEVYQQLKTSKKSAVCLGSLQSSEKCEKKVEIINSSFDDKKAMQKKRVGVLSSGKGTNLQALIDYSQNSYNLNTTEISVIVSDTESKVLEQMKAKVPTKVLNSNNYKTAEDFDMAIHETLNSYNVDIVCLDEFSRNISDSFVELWRGKILNVYPSLLPAFKCANVHEEVLNLGARITGCTVYIVEPEGKIGEIIDQAAVCLEAHETIETLKKKVTQLQYCIYPKAVELFARKIIGSCSNIEQLDDDISDLSLMHLKSPSDFDLQAQISTLMKSTERPGSCKTASVCGIFNLKDSGYQLPYLVSGTDGVGTKLKIAQACNKHDTIGIDLVAMCVNDILTHGAEPLFFLESLDCGNTNPENILNVIAGIAEGCKQAKCALIGAEICQMPDIYLNSKCLPDLENYDVVGYAEGAVMDKNLLPCLDEIKSDDTVIGLMSSGIHSNGYSLVRKIVEIKNLRYQDPAPFDKAQTLGEALLTPTKIYVQSVLPLMKKGLIKAAAHITGGGLTENIPRVLPQTCQVVLDGNKWVVPPVLKWIAQEGNLSAKEMLKTFNCGIGMVLIISKEHENEVLESLKLSGETSAIIGYVKQREEGKLIK
ncbi:Trifunctional purine biosynthetic protein adenosine-3, partial [Stegodyphus mimosarum]